LTFKEYLGNLRGKRTAVAGAGISNTPLIEALLSAGINTLVCDRRARDEMGEAAERFERLGAKLSLGPGYLDDLDADVVFRTPGLMPSSPGLMAAVGRGAVLTSEMEVFFEVCPCKIIGVTGSDGKTTTTSIIAEILKLENKLQTEGMKISSNSRPSAGTQLNRDKGRTVYVGGNIGTPLLTRADEMGPDDIAVLELSSFQLISMNKCPDIAVVTNVSPNHLDVHSDMDEYIGAKRNIFLRQNRSDRAVFNHDDCFRGGFYGSFPSEAPGEVLIFSSRSPVRDGVYLDGGMIYEAIGGKEEAIMQADEILLPGLHNAENFMAAFAAVRGLAGKQAMAETARSFRGVRHRIELVRTHKGVSYYNDSIASSPSRTIAGLRAFDRKVILIAGGKDKGVGFEGLGAEIVSHVKTLVLTGMTAERIHNAVINEPGYSGSPGIIRRESFKDAVLAASAEAQEGDVVLLSPACTSFDRFRNFEERGETFRRIVEEL